MKLKAVLLALVVAGASATVALADNGHGNGKGDNGKKAGTATALATSSTTSTTSTTTTTASKEHGKSAAKAPSCKPNFSLNLQGTVVSAAAGDVVGVLVAKGNSHGRSLAGKQVSVDVSHAKIVRHGQKKAADLVAKDRVQVKAKACANADLTGLKIVATQVVVLGAKDTTKDDDEDGTTTSSTTSTTTTTSSSSTTSTTTPVVTTTGA